VQNVTNRRWSNYPLHQERDNKACIVPKKNTKFVRVLVENRRTLGRPRKLWEKIKIRRK
jgi:hypothetical protein